MSALSYISEYGSNSEESDCDDQAIVGGPKRPRLHVPDLSGVAVVPSEIHVDDPTVHGGRKRSFPHVRGNWSSFVYVKYPEEENFCQLIDKLQSEVLTIDESCQKCEDVHISLTKTFVLKYHLITSFTTSLQEATCGIESFKLSIDSIKVYCNEENTRTFIALQVDHFSNKQLSSISQKIDGVLTDYKLPKFYDDPSYHASILWTNGNKKKELTKILDNLNDILIRELRQTHEIVWINKVHCKIGNKYFQYCLQ